LTTFGPDIIVMGEDQIARAMIEYEMGRGDTQPMPAAPAAAPSPASPA
jgi:hypothetical protein